jgi:hypothetical protein
MRVEKDSRAYRVLVELAGLDRAAKLQELWENLGRTSDPEDLRHCLNELRYEHLVEIKYYFTENDWGSDDTNWWRITWQGQETLREVDLPDTRRMRALRPSDLPWRQRLKRVWRSR